MNKWITFDLDETLMQNPLSDYVFPEIVRIIEHKLNGKNRDILKLIIAKHTDRMQMNRIMAYDWDDIVSELTDELKVPVDVNVEQLVIKHAVEPKVYLLEEAILDNLQRIQKQGYKLGVATNGFYKYQYPVLKTLKLNEVFDEIITADFARYAKPDPRFLHKLHHNENIVAHVGDRIDHDVVMANQLGITSIFINRDLPKEVLKVPIFKRRNEPLFMNYLKEKWQKESDSKSNILPDTGIPDIVICSIDELERNLKWIV